MLRSSVVWFTPGFWVRGVGGGDASMKDIPVDTQETWGGEGVPRKCLGDTVRQWRGAFRPLPVSPSPAG